jgi:hypothetical protein
MIGRNFRTLALLAAIAVILACVPTLAPSAPPTLDPPSINTIIAQTAGAAATQTAMWMPPSSTSSLTPLPTNTPRVTPTSTPTFIFRLYTATPTPPTAGISRVMIVSFDGLRPEAIELAPMPNLLALMESGATSLSAQTVSPSATLPSHTSMLSGLCPVRHGVTWNDYIPANGFARGTDLFDLAHAAGLQTVMYVGKEKLRQITEPASTDIFVYINDRDLVIAKQLLADFPDDFGLLFVHFPTMDGMGHEYGWLSAEQLSVAYRGDEALGLLLGALDARALRAETLVIVTADHGGHNTTHGSSLPEDMTIPWIASGPGVQPGQLTTRINIQDTAATAAWALGLPVPPEWDGVPVLEAFGLPAVEGSETCK